MFPVVAQIHVHGETSMSSLRSWLRKFALQSEGRIAVEYALAAALIAIAVLAGIRLLGNATNNQNNSTSNMLQNASTPSSS
jgi:Flp pilus assembly pilin Flp